MLLNKNSTMIQFCAHPRGQPCPIGLTPAVHIPMVLAPAELPLSKQNMAIREMQRLSRRVNATFDARGV